MELIRIYKQKQSWKWLAFFIFFPEQMCNKINFVLVLSWWTYIGPIDKFWVLGENQNPHYNPDSTSISERMIEFVIWFWQITFTLESLFRDSIHVKSITSIESYQTKYQSVDSHDIVVPHHLIDSISAFIHMTFLVRRHKFTHKIVAEFA